MGSGLHAKNRDEEIRRAERLAKKVIAESMNFGGKEPREAFDVLKKVYPVNVAKRMAVELTNRNTNVASGLQPEISKQKIVIPAKETTSGANGTGLIGIDDHEDFDAPEDRKFDLHFSSADGSDDDDFYSADGGIKSKINVTQIVAGMAIGAALVYFITKYKSFKNI